MENEELSPNQPLEVHEHENFERWYTNNISYQPTDMDLTMVFGELERKSNKTGVRQHTAMTMTWEQAKITLYFLQVNIVMREIMVGKINVPRSLWPSPPPIPEEETTATERAVYEAVKVLYDAFLTGL